MLTSWHVDCAESAPAGDPGPCDQAYDFICLALTSQWVTRPHRLVATWHQNRHHPLGLRLLCQGREMFIFPSDLVMSRLVPRMSRSHTEIRERPLCCELDQINQKISSHLTDTKHPSHFVCPEIEPDLQSHNSLDDIFLWLFILRWSLQSPELAFL